MPWYPWDLWSYATVCGDVPSTPMYKVNAAGCGKGKSTHNKKFITAHKDTRFLVIVPSLALADEYADYGTTIHSGNSHNVKQQVYKAIEANTRVLVITQKAFLDFESKTLLCTNRTVLQDEHLEPFYVCKWQMANHAQWLDMFVVGASDKEGWYKVTLNTARVAEFLATADMLDNKQFMQDLLATPQAIYTNKATMEMESMEEGWMVKIIVPMHLMRPTRKSLQRNWLRTFTCVRVCAMCCALRPMGGGVLALSRARI